MRLKLDWPHVMGFREGILCRHTESFDQAVREGVALSIPFSFKDVQFLETIKSGGILMGSFHVVGVYKNGNHLISFQQQNESSAMWVHGPGSRTSLLFQQIHTTTSRAKISNLVDFGKVSRVNTKRADVKQVLGSRISSQCPRRSNRCF